MKNTFFNPSRFVNVCRKDMVESWKPNLLRILVMYGIMTVIFVWRGYFAYKEPHSADFDPVVLTSVWAFIYLCWIFGCLSASFTMEQMKTKTSRLSVLMTPATSFEKFISRWLISTVVFLVTFIIAYLLADYTRVLICSIIYPDATIVTASLKYIFAPKIEQYYFFSEAYQLNATIMSYFFFQSCFILGSSIWPKNSFIKTFIAGFLILLSYGLIGGWVLKLFVGQSYVPGDFQPNLSDIELANIVYIVATVFIVLNWTLAYYRFKEAEIINRI